MRTSPEAVRTLPEALGRAGERGGGLVYVRPDGTERTQSYAELRDAAERLLGGLRSAGIRPGDRVVLQLSEPQDYLTGFWACLLGGAVAVPIAATAGPALTRSVVQLCGQSLLVTAERLPALRAGRPPWPGTERTAGRERRRRPWRPDRDWHPAEPDDVFVILFTSGSTGKPKGVTLTHRNALSMIEAYTRLLHLTEHEVSFNWMPLDHVGGLLAFHMRDVYLGCRQVHTSPAAVLGDPLRWLDWLDHYRATCTWAPNFAYGLIVDELARSPDRAWELSRLRHILNAGEMIVPATMHQFLTLLGPHGLPPTAICPSWGMSETSGGVTFATNFTVSSTDRFVDVGPAIPGVRIRVVDDQDGGLADGQAGRVQVTGPTVTSGYYRAPELDAGVFTSDGWFDTGDIGLLRDGRLTITGRAKDIIIVNGLNYYCQEVEAAVEQVAGVMVSYTGACAVRAPEDHTDTLAVFYCTRLTDQTAVAEQWREIRRRVREVTGIHPTHLLPVPTGAIPKTETGKVRRDELRRAFAGGDFDPVRARVAGFAGEPAGGEPAGEVVGRLAAIWQRALGVDRVGVHDDFFDLGGDSLVTMRIVALARADGLSVTEHQIVETRTIAGLAEAIGRNGQ